jgi:hypothetical protein
MKRAICATASKIDCTDVGPKVFSLKGYVRGDRRIDGALHQHSWRAPSAANWSRHQLRREFAHGADPEQAGFLIEAQLGSG